MIMSLEDMITDKYKKSLFTINHIHIYGLSYNIVTQVVLNVQS